MAAEGAPPMSSPSPKNLLIDDGELDLVRSLFVELGADYEEIQASSARTPLPLPTTLLVTTSSHAAVLKLHRTRSRQAGEPTWLAFIEADSRTQSRLLRDAGFDFVVPSRVHPAALRLLLARGCFDGDDTQRVTRVAFGGEITFGPALRRRKAIMIEISPRGCRFLTSKPPKVDARFAIQIPRDHRGAFELEGKVVRLAPGRHEGGLQSETAVGFRFAPLKPEQVEQLKGILIERLAGPLPLPPGVAVIRPVAPQPRFRTAGAPPSAPTRARPATPTFAGADEQPTQPALTPRRRVLVPDSPTTRTALTPPPRRLALLDARDAPTEPGPQRLPRAVFEREVAAICAGGTRVLLGRDLSEQGMRVERHGKLGVGERVRIVIHAAAREEPLLVEAHVDRDDGPRGMLLRFDFMEHADLGRLRRLIEALPKIRRLDDDTPTHTTFLTELLPARKR